MAKAVTIKVKLVSSADTGFYYVDQEEFAHDDREDGQEEIRSDREEARRIPRRQDQVTFANSRHEIGRRKAPFFRGMSWISATHCIHGIAV